MGYAVLAPPAPLSDWVESIWDWDMPQQAHRFERMLPSACAQLTINLAEDETRVYDDALNCKRNAGAALDAPSHRSFVIDTAEQVAVCGVVFKPGAAAPLFRQRMDALANGQIDLDDLLPGHGRDLRTRLLEAGSAARRLAILQNWLETLARDAQPQPAIAHALHAFEASPQIGRIGAIAADCGWSPRRFSQCFRERVGMSPKRYARLQRFHRVAAIAQRGGRIDWAGVAADAGFHDQPHLVREFRAFSGFAPTAYLAQRGPWPGHIPLD